MHDTNQQDITISIPASIARLPGLSLLEQIVLDHIHRALDCSNGRLGAGMAKELPESRQRALAEAFCGASAEKLAVFRQRVETGELATTAVRVIELGSE